MSGFCLRPEFREVGRFLFYLPPHFNCLVWCLHIVGGQLLLLPSVCLGIKNGGHRGSSDPVPSLPQGQTPRPRPARTLFPFHKGGGGHPERPSKLSKVTQLVRTRNRASLGPRVAFCAQDGRVCFSEALVGFAGSPAVCGPRQALGGVRHLPAPLSPISAELRALNKNARL